jgi:intracellular sulfur oxidation DsrE/DsrF family protein
VTPHFVLAFRSGATFFVQTDMDKIKPENREYAPKIVTKLQELSQASGIDSLEQCSVAMRLTHVAAEHIVSEVKVVGNGWISLMAYQARGYAYIQP